MSFITELDVGYGSALLPTPYKRLANKHGVVTNLQAVANGTPVSLWLRSGDEAPAVVDVGVVHGEEPAPEGWKKIARDVTAGATPGKTAYIVYKTGDPAGEVKPIDSLAVLGEGDAPGTRTHWGEAAAAAFRARGFATYAMRAPHARVRAGSLLVCLLAVVRRKVWPRGRRFRLYSPLRLLLRSSRCARYAHFVRHVPPPAAHTHCLPPFIPPGPVPSSLQNPSSRWWRGL
jgi:hypothetical protein